MQSDAIQLLDCRSADAYNGWPMKGESRGGHIPGARSMPFKWMHYLDWIDIVENKSISKEKQIVIYGYDQKEMEEMAIRFSRMGYPNVAIFTEFLNEWVSHEGHPLHRMQRYKHLVPPEWVKELIEGGNPIHYENDRFLILHAHYRNRNAYLSGHIPGAIDMDTLAVESPDTWNRRSPEELRRNFEAHGITEDTTVVVYGKYMNPDNDDAFPGSAAGQIGAIRTAFILMYAGVRDVRVLNGGFQSWQDAGFQVDSADVAKIPVADYGGKIPRNPGLAVDLPEAKMMLSSQDADLVCVRSWPEYIGEVSGYNYIEKKGRIPGAIFGNCGSDAYHMENYRNPDHTTREFPEVEKFWKANGITPDKHLAFYCGTGWRGSEAFYNAWLMGWPRVSVFDGGWFEWSNDPLNPFETGIPGDVL